MVKKPFFISPVISLKAKVGDGGLPLHVLKKCQDYLESNPIDFKPYGMRHLHLLQDIKQQIIAGHIDDESASRDIINTVMQFKSNGSMFHYQLISMISDVMFRFLEHTTNLDKDFLEIFSVYLNVIEVVLNKQLTGNGGREGYALTQELNNACLRYYSKKGISV